MTVKDEVLKKIMRKAYTARELAEVVGTSYAMVRKCLSELRADGRVTSDMTHGGFPKRYKGVRK